MSPFWILHIEVFLTVLYIHGANFKFFTILEAFYQIGKLGQIAGATNSDVLLFLTLR